MTDKKKFRIKEDAINTSSGARHPFRDGIGKVFEFVQYEYVDYDRFKDTSKYWATNGYWFHESQLEPVEEFTFKRRGNIDAVQVYLDGKRQISVYDSTSTESIDRIEQDYLQTIRMYRGAIAYRESKKNDERQKYIDSLSSIITPEAAVALYDAGIKMSKD